MQYKQHLFTYYKGLKETVVYTAFIILIIKDKETVVYTVLYNKYLAKTTVSLYLY